VFQPLLLEHFSYDELCQLRLRVIELHQKRQEQEKFTWTECEKEYSSLCKYHIDIYIQSGQKMDGFLKEYLNVVSFRIPVLTLDKEPNILIYGMPFCIIIYMHRSYKLLKMVHFSAPCILEYKYNYSMICW